MSHKTKLTQENYPLHLGDRGRLVLPAEVRRRLDLKDGERLILTVEEDGSLRLVSARMLARQLKGLFRELSPGVDLAEELIAERRAEATRE
jgi:AbrB family looped-hinge helix DNA binding protein